MLNVLSPLARIDVLSVPRAISQGVPFRVVIDGVTYERVTLEGQYVSINGQPAYMQVS